MEWLTSNNTCWKKRQDANMLSDIVRREAMSQNGFKFSKPDAKLPYFWDRLGHNHCGIPNRSSSKSDVDNLGNPCSCSHHPEVIYVP